MFVSYNFVSYICVTNSQAMQTPFTYGRVATGKNFTNRTLETQRLVANFTSGTNTILISPRRWGKSSLVFHAAGQCQKIHPNLKFIFIDLFNTRNEEQFYELLARETLKAFSTGSDAILKAARTLLGRFLPKITFSPSADTSFELTLDWEEVKKQPHEILMLAEVMARQKGKKAIVCIDEFQNISHFDEPGEFQKVLRANWQLHQHVSYCLYGSKRNMMVNVFTSPSMPFYKFGDILFLEKIKEADWHSYISEQFALTRKSIDPQSLNLITQLTENHPYYVQQLAQQVWLRTDKACHPESVSQAFEDIVRQMSMLFHSLTDALNTTQLNFLKAVINEEKQLSSKDVIEKYRLGTSANIQRIKKSLLDKEIIDLEEKTPVLLDPLYQYWLRNYYFEIRE
jgi:uncharacterized protein